MTYVYNKIPDSKVKHTLVEVELGAKTAHAKVDEWEGRKVASLRFVWEPEPGKIAYTRHGVNVPLWELPVAVTAMLEAFNEATGSNLVVTNMSNLDVE